MDLATLPAWLRDPAVQIGAGVVATLLALGLAVGSAGGSSGSSGGIPPVTSTPSTTVTEPTTTAPTTTPAEPTTTVPTTPAEPTDVTVTAYGTPGAVTVQVKGTAPGWSLYTLRYNGGVAGFGMANKGSFEFTSSEPLDVSSPSVEVEVLYQSCTPNWRTCGHDNDRTFTHTVPVNYR